MLLLPKHDALFYHVYRAAGSSIRTALRPFASTRQRAMQRANFALKAARLLHSHNPLWLYHPRLTDVRAAMGERFDSLYRFAFVRDPLDWQHSYYHHARRKAHHHHHKVAMALPFDRYLSWKLDNAFHTQAEYLFDGEECLVNDLFRFESLETDWQAVTARLGIDARLPHVNAAQDGAPPRLSGPVLERFKAAAEPDYRLFGYAMP